MGSPGPGITDFATRLHQALRNDGTGKNFAYSPLGTSLLLGAVVLGGKGETAKEITTALSYPVKTTELVSEMSNTLKSIKKAQSGDFQLTTSQKLLVQKGYDVNVEYLEILIRHFDTGMKQVNFDGSMKNEILELNAWVSKETDGKITKALTEGSLSSDQAEGNPIRLVLMNIIYFRGFWAYPFNQPMTRSAEFYPLGRKPWENVSVKMMTHDGGINLMRKGFHYTPLDVLMDARAVKLPYKGGRFSMIIYVPNLRNGLPKIEKAITGIPIGEILKQLQIYTKKLVDSDILLEIYIPRFKIEADVNLAKGLRKLGIQSAFQPGMANFAGISDDPEGLYIGVVQQKVIVEVDELGTTAAAVTRLSLRGGGCPEKVQVVADRSFYFQIVDEEQELIIFSGSVIDPTQTE